MKRTPLKRKTPLKRTGYLKRTGPLRRVSSTKAQWNHRYAKALKERKNAQVKERGRTYCERCQKAGPVTGHHPGGQNGARIMRFRLICWRPCHHWIHFENPNQARAEGWLDKR